ncbi:RING finger protein 112 [Bombina bombina]|uniref:RING finger protein 112 n=1 Tax=Bombina bombina TaxID=8345 RepID=UPI00235B03D5|nr:RING finger protein 112 [Bombina bombina]XP_053551257.1 RING finger protein 112 [Bombina bombina]
MPQGDVRRFERLEEEDITCCVCAGVLSDPVSIACGHTFCKHCISFYWQTSGGSLCPECRATCPRNQLIPVHRLRSLIEKVQNVLNEDQAWKEAPGRAVQLVYEDIDGHFKLDEDAVKSCFSGNTISNYSVCLISVLGKKHLGKSLLMNYILRALHCQEKGQPLSLGLDDAPLHGFGWNSRSNNITRGIWIWNRPFILENKGKKVAVFVLDTEGSMDAEGDRENCIKLSALSVMLSSYMIFNVHARLQTAELDYLQMYTEVGELLGKSFLQQQLQHLDLLVRDWHNCDNCGRGAALSFLDNVEKEHCYAYPCVEGWLACSSVSCHLLPHPGIGLIRSGQGKLSDMNKDFRSHLTIYVCELVRGVWSHLKTDAHENILRCGELCSALKEFGDVLQRQYTFASPSQMFFSLNNYDNMKRYINVFKEFLCNQATTTSSPLKVLGVTPNKMRLIINNAAQSLLQTFGRTLQYSGGNQKQILLDELMSQLLQLQEDFCDDHSKRFKKCAVGCVFGAGVLGLVGGVSGAIVAGGALAVGATSLFGSTAAAITGGAVGGSLTLGAIGGSLGARVGEAFGRRIEKRDKKDGKGS